jgi:hypothetical protein
LTVSKDSPREFEIALEEAALDPGKPNPWIDWGSNTDEREDYERTTPTKQDALDLCDGCPFYNLCTDAAIAKPPYHGVRGAGLRFENGRRLK